MTVKKLIVKGSLITNIAQVDFKNLSIELFDQSQKVNGVIASSAIDKNGNFKFEMNPLTLKRWFEGVLPEVYFQISRANDIVFSTIDDSVIVLDKNRDDIKIDLPKEIAQELVPIKQELPKVEIKEILKSSGISAQKIPDIQKQLKKVKLDTLEAVLKKPSKLTKKSTGLDKVALKKFKAATQFSAISGSSNFSERLIANGFDSLTNLGLISIEAVEARVGKLSKTEKNQLAKTHLAATHISNHVMNRAASIARLKSRDGNWKNDDKDKTQSDENSCRCEACDNVFSPYAYLVSLLDMVNDHWGLSAFDLEQILKQDINNLDCKKSQQCFLQIELAIEVLEKSSRTKLPFSNSKILPKIKQVLADTLFSVSDDVKTASERVKLLEKFAQSSSSRVKKILKNLEVPKFGLTGIRDAFVELRDVKEIVELAKISGIYSERGDAYKAAIDSAYGKILVLYRDALIAQTKKSTEFLQKELYIDLKASACHKTNQLTFLILAIQAFVLAGRTGQARNHINPVISSASNLQVLKNKLKNLDAIPIEEASWKWLKDYSTWASAMYVFLYPENVAMPFLAKNLGEDFTEFGLDFITNPKNRKSVFTSIYEYFFDENARNFVRNVNSHLADRYPLFLKTVIEPGEGYFDAVKVQANDFMHNLDSLISSYSDIEIFNNTIISSEKLEKRELKIGLFIPMVAGLSLNKSEQFESAHEWYSLIYDPTKSGKARFGVKFSELFKDELILGESWSEGVLNPDEIASKRNGVMLRHVILLMVKNLLDWADHQFALSTTTSLDRARQLYELAHEVLDSPDLRDHCGRSIKELALEIVTRYGLDPAIVAGTLVPAIENLNQIDDPKIILQTITKIGKILPKNKGDIDPPEIANITSIVDTAVNKYKASLKVKKISDRFLQSENAVGEYEDSVIENSALNYSQGVNPIFFSSPQSGLSASVAQISHSNYWPYKAVKTFCIPPNPVLVALDRYIELSLLKFQLCLDITGEPLPTVVINEDSVAEFFDTVNAEVERRPLLNDPANWFNQPPRYRYSYLVEKARQYTDVAQRIGAILLQAYQNKDNEDLAVLTAQHAIEISSSTVDLRNLGLIDAVNGLDLANIQTEKAEAQLEFWQDRIDSGIVSDTEKAGLALIALSAGIQLAVGTLQVGPIAAVVGGAAAVGSALSLTGAGTAPGLVVLGASAAAAGAAIPMIAQGVLTIGGGLGTAGNGLLTYAGFERRFEDWGLQQTLSGFDARIAENQKVSAQNRINIANMEMDIAQLQNTQASEVLTFHENKFSNSHLYEWMIQVLSQSYRSLMQISANIAKHAQQALEFERQESITIINGDYWSVNSALAFSGNLSDEQKNSGLLGAERLLTDLTRLDAYKVGTERRRLQMSKNISMAQMLPGELAELRNTGKISFNTLMNWFDRDFPGHYLRLIKSVKVSILALTPPTDGIHAVLSNNGESSVIVPDGLDFKPIRSFRETGERIALDSPFNETGLFVFDYNDPMLLPFEGLGVETQWSLDLPKASNRFDFDTIVDVIFTIEYTALHSDKYQGIVIDSLGTTDINEVPLVPRLYFPDAWYHFKNDPIIDNSRKLTIDVSEAFMPNHYVDKTDAKAKHVTLIVQGDFSGLNTAQGKKLEEAITVQHASLRLSKKADATVSPPVIAFKTNVLDKNKGSMLHSSRDVNNVSHLPISNVNPLGEWEIQVKDMVLDGVNIVERINDILLVITTEGDVS